MTDPLVSSANSCPAYMPLPADASGQVPDSVSDAQIEQIASDILGTGERFLTDDYDSRAVRFGEEMAQLSPEDGARLVQELLRRDSGALHSWLKLDIIDRMQRSEEHTSE